MHANSRVAGRCVLTCLVVFGSLPRVDFSVFSVFFGFAGPSVCVLCVFYNILCFHFAIVRVSGRPVVAATPLFLDGFSLLLRAREVGVSQSGI